jgi:hypothetical protein
MNIKNSVLDYIRHKKLNWYGHVKRMDEERLLRRILNGAHLEDEERKDLKVSWMQDVTTGLRDRKIGD